MKTFVYKTIKTTKEIDDAKLNQAGRQGWELCGVTTDTYGYVYYFKKEGIEK